MLYGCDSLTTFPEDVYWFDYSASEQTVDDLFIDPSAEEESES